MLGDFDIFSIDTASDVSDGCFAHGNQIKYLNNLVLMAYNTALW